MSCRQSKNATKSISLAREILRLRDLEFHAIGYAGLRSRFSCQFDGLRMIIETHECGFRIACAIRIVEVPSPQPTSATFAPCLQFRLRVAERGNPFADQMRAVIRTEKSLRAGKKRVIMLVPAHALAGEKGIRDFRLRP